MSLFTRKLVCLFFLNLVFCSLKSQLPLPVGPIAGILRNSMPTVKLFKSCKFDSAEAIIGIDLTDSTNGRAGLYSFIIDNSKDLTDLKKGWIFKDAARSESNQGLFKVFYTKNKILTHTWVVFPNSFSIVTDQGLYLFDVSLLTKLHAKSPLRHSVHIDTLTSKSDYFRFYDSVKANPSFLFLNEPELVGEGTFEVKLKAASRNIPDDVGLRIIDICNKAKPKTAFKVYFKDGDEAADTKHKTYVVRGDRSLFEQFSDPEMEKANWMPAIYPVESYWRE